MARKFTQEKSNLSDSFISRAGELVLSVGDEEYRAVMRQARETAAHLNYLKDYQEARKMYDSDSLQSVTEDILSLLEGLKDEAYFLEEKAVESKASYELTNKAKDLAEKIRGLYRLAVGLAQAAKNVSQEVDAKLAEDLKRIAYHIENRLYTRLKYKRVMEILNKIKAALPKKKDEVSKRDT